MCRNLQSSTLTHAVGYKVVVKRKTKPGYRSPATWVKYPAIGEGQTKVTPLEGQAKKTVGGYAKDLCTPGSFFYNEKIKGKTGVLSLKGAKALYTSLLESRYDNVSEPEDYDRLVIVRAVVYGGICTGELRVRTKKLAKQGKALVEYVVWVGDSIEVLTEVEV